MRSPDVSQNDSYVLEDLLRYHYHITGLISVYSINFTENKVESKAWYKSSYPLIFRPNLLKRPPVSFGFALLKGFFLTLAAGF
jgi:hypothetical protein